MNDNRSLGLIIELRHRVHPDRESATMTRSFLERIGHVPGQLPAYGSFPLIPVVVGVNLTILRGNPVTTLTSHVPIINLYVFLVAFGSIDDGSRCLFSFQGSSVSCVG